MKRKFNFTLSTRLWRLHVDWRLEDEKKTNCWEQFSSSEHYNYEQLQYQKKKKKRKTFKLQQMPEGAQIPPAGAIS